MILQERFCSKATLNWKGLHWRVVCNTGVFSSFCSVENKYRINVRVNYSYVLYIFQIIHIFGQVSYLCLRRNEYSALLCLNFVRRGIVQNLNMQFIEMRHSYLPIFIYSFQAWYFCWFIYFPPLTIILLLSTCRWKMVPCTAKYNSSNNYWYTQESEQYYGNTQVLYRFHFPHV